MQTESPNIKKTAGVSFLESRRFFRSQIKAPIYYSHPDEYQDRHFLS